MEQRKSSFHAGVTFLLVIGLTLVWSNNVMLKRKVSDLLHFQKASLVTQSLQISASVQTLTSGEIKQLKVSALKGNVRDMAILYVYYDSAKPVSSDGLANEFIWKSLLIGVNGQKKDTASVEKYYQHILPSAKFKWAQAQIKNHQKRIEQFSNQMIARQMKAYQSINKSIKQMEGVISNPLRAMYLLVADSVGSL